MTFDYDSMLQAMWNNLYQLEDEMEKKHGLDPIERLNVQNGFESALEAVVSFESVLKAVSARWHAYPDEQPPECGVYLVSEHSCLTKKISFVWIGYWDGEKWYFAENFAEPNDIGKWIYAWMELPEPMQKEEQDGRFN